MKYSKIIKTLKSQRNPRNIEGMARFGISRKGTLGISIPILRKMGKDIGKDHALAKKLWASRIHEARMLAIFIGEPEKVTEKEMSIWVKDIDSWDICDQLCSNLWDRTPFAYKKAFQWSRRREEFVKRTGFVLMATLSVHDKQATNATFEKFFPIMIREAQDKRNYVKKAVNWSLRQIGKRNLSLNKKAVTVAKRIQKLDSRSARWIANDAIRELTSKKTLEQIKKRS